MIPLPHDRRASSPAPALDLVLTAIIAEQRDHRRNAPLSSLAPRNDFPLQKPSPDVTQLRAGDWQSGAKCSRRAQQTGSLAHGGLSLRADCSVCQRHSFLFTYQTFPLLWDDAQQARAASGGYNHTFIFKFSPCAQLHYFWLCCTFVLL